MINKMVDLGSLNIATPTFTDGNQMPTITEMGVSRQTSGAVYCEVTTALNATPGSITVTYVDQDGNSAETTSAQSLPTSNNGIKAGGFIFLNSTDTGVRDITTATRTGGTTPTGIVKFWGLIPIALMIGTANGSQNIMENLLTSGFNPVRLGAGDVVKVLVTAGSTTAAAALSGNIFIVGDT